MHGRRASQHPVPPRLGPRPLPLHLMAHAATLLSSRAALPFLRSGSLPWRPNLAEAAESLRRSLADAGADGWARFDAAVAQEALARHAAFLAGIEAYRRHPWRRSLPPVPELCRWGSTRLLDYRRPEAPAGPPVLVIPSLVNRATILDLLPTRSLMRDLAGRGLAPFLVDWDAPGPEEQGFTLTDYVAVRLEAALDAVLAATGRPAALLGYCMGGLLALALAQRRPADVGRMVLLATPWDFHAGREAHAAVMNALAGPLGQALALMGDMPVDLLQSLFMSLDPALAVRKFTTFAAMPPKSARARDFVAVEDWANDGVPLAGAVARECLFGWYGANDPPQGRWRVGGQPVRPEAVRAPALLVVPARDRIVPPDSALPLAARLPGSRVMTSTGGHVGMLLARRARTEVYAPIAGWLCRSTEK